MADKVATAQPIVVVDIDGVLFNTPIDAVKAFNTEHQASYHVNDIFDHDAKHDKSKFVVDGVDQFHKHQLDTQSYSQVEGAKEALQYLRRKNVRVIALTSRNYDKFHDSTLAAIDKHFGLGDGDDDLIAEVYFANDPDDGQHREKGEMIKEMGGSILVDDAVRYCESAVAHGLPAILLAQPYNETGHTWPLEKRADTWGRAVELIEQELGLD